MSETIRPTAAAAAAQPELLGTRLGDTPDPTADLIESLMQLIRLAKAKDFFTGSGLSRMQVAILTYLRRRSPRRLTSLADHITGDLSVISRQVNALCESGMIDRARDPEDGRAWLISLTADGAEALEEIGTRRRQWFATVLGGFEPAELERATAILTTIGEAWEHVIRHPADQTAAPPP